MSISEQGKTAQDIANDLYNIAYFDADVFEATDESTSLFIVADFHDTVPLHDWKCCSMCFFTVDPQEIRRAAPVLNRSGSVFVVIANAEQRRLISDLLALALPELMQFVPPDEAFGHYETLWELLDDGGEKALDTLLATARQRPVYGLIELADVRTPKRGEAVMSGIRTLDQNIGGFAPGELSVWTGTRGSGKSTLVSGFLLDAISQGRRVCAYSGELPAWQYRAWALAQAAGPNCLTEQINPRSGKSYFSVWPDAERRIDAWWRERYYLYDNTMADANNAENIIRMFNLALRRHGCTVFLCDNLMTARFSQYDRDFYRDQSEFVGRLVEFAKKNNVHVHLVAHPRKAGDKNLTADDVGGSGDITNRADNAFSLKRITEEGAEFDAGLTVLKNRESGVLDAKIKLCFDQPSRRFYELGSLPDKKYGWEDDLSPP